MDLFTKTGRRYVKASPEQIAENHLHYHQHQLAPVGVSIANPTDSERFLIDALTGQQREVFAVLLLDKQHRVINFCCLFYGTIDAAAVYPREVVKHALRFNAAAAILAHNHPSGVAEPSKSDELTTRRIRDALQLVDVRLLDHFVIGRGQAVSLASRGML